MAISSAYFTNLSSQAHALAANTSKVEADVCADIRAFEQETMAEMQSLTNALRAKIASLVPMTTIPSDLPGCISWITQAAQPFIKAIAAAEADLTTALSGVAQVESAIQSASSGLTSCSITPTPVA